MEWDWELIVKIIGGIAAFFVAIQKIKEFSARHKELQALKTSIQIFDLVPSDWESKIYVKNKIENDLYRMYHPDGIEKSKVESIQSSYVFMAVTCLFIAIILIFFKSYWSIFFAVMGFQGINHYNDNQKRYKEVLGNK